MPGWTPLSHRLLAVPSRCLMLNLLRKHRAALRGQQIPTMRENVRLYQAENTNGALIINAEDEEGVNTTSAPQKKRRLESQGGLVDANVTPRRRSIPNSTASLSDSEAGSLSSASWTRRQLMQLRLSKTGIEYTPLRERSVPAAAKALLMAIKKISHCHEILPAALKSTIMQDQELTTESLEGSEWRFSFRPDHERDDLPGQIPSITEMKKVLINAIECSNFRHEEASWNALVHLQLLRLILNNDVGQQYDDFNAIPWLACSCILFVW